MTPSPHTEANVTAPTIIAAKQNYPTALSLAMKKTNFQVSRDNQSSDFLSVNLLTWEMGK